MELIYDTPVEVTSTQYRKLMVDCAGIVFGREDAETGKFFIKLALPAYKEYVKQIILTTK